MSPLTTGLFWLKSKSNSFFEYIFESQSSWIHSVENTVIQTKQSKAFIERSLI
jgi:hypothetical protein